MRAKLINKIFNNCYYWHLLNYIIFALKINQFEIIIKIPNKKMFEQLK